MLGTTHDDRRRLESLDRADLARLQLERLNSLLARILPQNGFYAAKLAGIHVPLKSLAALQDIPCTSKDELIAPDRRTTSPPIVPIRSISMSASPHVRHARPSPGGAGHRRRLAMVDRQLAIRAGRGRSHAARSSLLGLFLRALHRLLDGVRRAAARGALVIPGGGLSTLARLDLLRTTRATTLCCTPSYALHLAEVARESGWIRARGTCGGSSWLANPAARSNPFAAA